MNTNPYKTIQVKVVFEKEDDEESCIEQSQTAKSAAA